MARTREPQYEYCLQFRDKSGLTPLGIMCNEGWENDPKRLAFVLSRYKFVAKMFAGLRSVLEIGCADAFGTRLVQQEVPDVTVIDFDPIFIEDVRARMSPRWPMKTLVHDMLQGPVVGNFDSAFSMDVLEHIPKESEDKFLRNIVGSLGAHGSLILGTPSIQSQPYASIQSREGHINCKYGKGLKELALRHFHRVFLFSMNDEVVHTGFSPMAQYLIALCCEKKD
jgi:2-polyprenyl-3-methyl-5-hydroxy-6-metoxy-1,4-benzoquinol methylase